MEHIRALHYSNASSIVEYLGTPVDAGIQEHNNQKTDKNFIDLQSNF